MSGAGSRLSAYSETRQPRAHRGVVEIFLLVREQYCGENFFKKRQVVAGGVKIVLTTFFSYRPRSGSRVIATQATSEVAIAKIEPGTSTARSGLAGRGDGRPRSWQVSRESRRLRPQLPVENFSLTRVPHAVD